MQTSTLLEPCSPAKSVPIVTIVATCGRQPTMKCSRVIHKRHAKDRIYASAATKPEIVRQSGIAFPFELPSRQFEEAFEIVDRLGCRTRIRAGQWSTSSFQFNPVFHPLRPSASKRLNRISIRFPTREILRHRFSGRLLWPAPNPRRTTKNPFNRVPLVSILFAGHNAIDLTNGLGGADPRTTQTDLGFDASVGVLKLV